MDVEIWRDIPGYEGLYQVSNIGNVRSLDRVIHGAYKTPRLFKGRLLKPSLSPRGYSQCVLSVDGTNHYCHIHQLVAMAFLNHKPNGYKSVVDHINNIPTDNRLENIQIVTNRYNSSKDKAGTSKHTGVSWHKIGKKWKASIIINGKNTHLGMFSDEDEAGLAYQNALSKLQENETILRLGPR